MEVRETREKPKPRRRFRVGLRGLIALVLLAGLALGWFVRQDRLACEQTARLTELSGMGVFVNEPYPTMLCWWAMRFLGRSSQEVETKLTRWVDPGWISLPRGFNAGMLKDEGVAAVVEKLRKFGPVMEVRFDRPPLVGLRLFYVNQGVPYERLGVPREAVTVKDHSSVRP